MESFFASLRKKSVPGEDFATRAEARSSLFEFIEMFCNWTRRHSSLGYKSPNEYERAGKPLYYAAAIRGEVHRRLGAARAAILPYSCRRGELIRLLPAPNYRQSWHGSHRAGATP